MPGGSQIRNARRQNSPFSVYITFSLQFHIQRIKIFIDNDKKVRENHGLNQPAVFWTAIEKDGFCTAVYKIVVGVIGEGKFGM